MDFNEYQDLAQRTEAGLPYSPRSAVAVLGLCGESGEVAELFKKHIGHGHELDLEHVKKELGDVLWYIAELASALGFSLEDVAVANIEKLAKRYPEGFSSERSKHRAKGDV